jgi:hypothetical protein
MKDGTFLVFMAAIATLSLVGMAIFSIWVNKILKTHKEK